MQDHLDINACTRIKSRQDIQTATAALETEKVDLGLAAMADLAMVATAGSVAPVRCTLLVQDPGQLAR